MVIGIIFAHFLAYCRDNLVNKCHIVLTQHKAQKKRIQMESDDTEELLVVWYFACVTMWHKNPQAILNRQRDIFWLPTVKIYPNTI